nr:DNA circularization N-terminal domain-containing protein [Sphingomonas sp. CARO-RG-8B-R24-01]
MTIFANNLLPASFRGVPFAVLDMSTQTGRRIALHQYPGRDEPWAEDMGRDARRIRFRGFIVENDPVYLGGPIELQRLALLATAEAAGPGMLTHPTLGLLKVACESISLGEALDGATYSSVEFSFVEAGAQSFPSLFLSSLGLSAEVVTGLTVAADAVRVLALAGNGAAGSASGSLPTVSGLWTGQITAAGNDATALSRLTASLPGNLGRYSRGATSGYLAALNSGSSDTLPQLVSLAAAQRAAIAAAVNNVSTIVVGLTVDTDETDYAVAAAALVASLAAACADPADALRLIAQLLAFYPAGQDAASPVGVAVTGLYQRLLALEMVRAAAAYQPSSYEDAFAQLVRVTGVLDQAITRAGNAGQDVLFSALRGLRASFVADMRARGATLAHVRTFTFARPLPAVTIAQRLYRDASRADEVIGEAGAACISPLFMPTTLQALAS